MAMVTQPTVIWQEGSEVGHMRVVRLPDDSFHPEELCGHDAMGQPNWKLGIEWNIIWVRKMLIALLDRIPLGPPVREKPGFQDLRRELREDEERRASDEEK